MTGEADYVSEADKRAYVLIGESMDRILGRPAPPRGTRRIDRNPTKATNDYDPHQW